MKHLKSFNIFEGNVNVSNSYYGRVDSEIVENCEDILRDFNEDNDCNIRIYMKKYNTIGVNNRIIFDKNARYNSFSKNVVDVLEDKTDIIGIKPYIEKSQNLTEKESSKFKEDFMKHIISYFGSLGYKYITDVIADFPPIRHTGTSAFHTASKGSVNYFFYIDNEVSEKPKSNLLKRFGKYVKNKLFEGSVIILSPYEARLDIEPEIVENCRDILRDFNEDNDCNFNLYLKPIEFNRDRIDIRHNLYQNFIKLEGRKAIVFSLSREFKIINGSIDNLRKCESYIVSYFTSIGYKFIRDNNKYYFYLDK